MRSMLESLLCVYGRARIFFASAFVFVHSFAPSIHSTVNLQWQEVFVSMLLHIIDSDSIPSAGANSWKDTYTQREREEK